MKEIKGFIQINENDLDDIIRPLEVKVWHFCMQIEGHEMSSESVSEKIIAEFKDFLKKQKVYGKNN